MVVICRWRSWGRCGWLASRVAAPHGDGIAAGSADGMARRHRSPPPYPRSPITPGAVTVTMGTSAGAGAPRTSLNDRPHPDFVGRSALQTPRIAAERAVHASEGGTHALRSPPTRASRCFRMKPSRFRPRNGT